ncbi:MAG: hypothetical protein M9916_00935 [Crocinitomicaceae bacterium]|nr:hypothetical protein [Crocinitomicaceae bacterium]
MNSIKTKSKEYKLFKKKWEDSIETYAVAGISVITKDDNIQIYIAWENEQAAKNGFFAITEKTFKSSTGFWKDFFLDTLDYGEDVTHLESARKLFPHLFKS